VDYMADDQRGGEAGPKNHAAAFLLLWSSSSISESV
jgi:hypothetical protein